KKFIGHDQLISIMSVHEMTSKCINIDFRFNVPCTLFRQKGAQILCFRGNFYCSVNPNYQKHLLSKGISYQMILHSKQDVQCHGASKLAQIFALRAKLKTYINERVSPETAAWFYALVLGDDSHIDEDIIDLFQDWNLSHLLAISGLHVGLVTALVYFILIKSNVLTREKAQWLMILFLPIYAFLAG